MFWTEIRAKDEEKADYGQMRKNLNVVEAPNWLIHMAAVHRILGDDLGYIKSAESGKPVLGSGEEIPMYAYPLVEYLMGLDLREMDVLEFGAGNSTVFFARRVRSLLSFENDAAWAAELGKQELANCEIRTVAEGGMAEAARALDRDFDIVIVDCRENRYAAAEAALPRLRAGGFAILDNSEWYPNTARLMRDSGLIQVDFHGFRALHHYSTTTSLYLHPDFRAKPAGARLPQVPIGGKDVTSPDWDSPAV